MTGIAIVLALIIVMMIMSISSKIKTKWLRPELSIIEILFVIMLSYIIVLQI